MLAALAVPTSSVCSPLCMLLPVFVTSGLSGSSPGGELRLWGLGGPPGLSAPMCESVPLRLSLARPWFQVLSKSSRCVELTFAPGEMGI